MTYLRELLTARFLIAMLVMALFGGAIIIMSFVSVPDANQQVVIQLIGGVNALAGLVIGFYFGSAARDDVAQPVIVQNPPDDPAIVQEQN